MYSSAVVLLVLLLALQAIRCCICGIHVLNVSIRRQVCRCCYVF